MNVLKTNIIIYSFTALESSYFKVTFDTNLKFERFKDSFKKLYFTADNFYEIKV